MICAGVVPQQPSLPLAPPHAPVPSPQEREKDVDTTTMQLAIAPSHEAHGTISKGTKGRLVMETIRLLGGRGTVSVSTSSRSNESLIRSTAAADRTPCVAQA